MNLYCLSIGRRLYRGAGRERIHNIADKKDVRLVTCDVPIYQHHHQLICKDPSYLNSNFNVVICLDGFYSIVL